MKFSFEIYKCSLSIEVSRFGLIAEIILFSLCHAWSCSTELTFPQNTLLSSMFDVFTFQKKIREFKPTLWIGLVEESSRSWLLHNTVGLKSWLVIQKSWTNLGFCFDEIGESNLGTKKFKRQRSCIIGRIQLKYIVKWKNISIISKIKIPSTNANHYGIFLLVVVLFYCENYLDLEVLYSHQHQYCVVLCAHKS